MKHWILLPCLMWVGSFLASVAVLWLWVRFRNFEGRRNPLTKDLLRGPGESLRDQIDDLNFDIAVYLGLSTTPVPFFYSVVVSHLAFVGVWPPVGWMIVYIVAGVGIQGWILWRLWNSLKKEDF